MTMQINLALNGKTYSANLARTHDISIPVRFGGEQLSAFGAPPAAEEAYAAGSFVGDVRRGGSCNCRLYRFSPHLHGTHTECVGHIAAQPIHVHEVLEEVFIPAALVTIAPHPNPPPQGGRKCVETYDPAPQTGDLLITRAALEHALRGVEDAFLAALAVRTLPNGEDKRTRDYAARNPPYFTHQAMRYMLERGVRHLLVDMPSIDRLDDGGKLSNHHIFWEMPQGSHDVDVKKPSRRTVTELIYVPDSVPDGRYLLNLQVAAFEGDAAPSRPVLCEIG